MNCNICKSKMTMIFNSRILEKYDVDYYNCETCAFLCTEKPNWLEEAYEEPINYTDTGLIARNIRLSKLISIICYFCFNNKKYLDHAGGYGVLTRLMRDLGFDFFWKDPYTENIFSKGFEFEGMGTTKFEVLTSVEAFEHFEYPSKEIEKMLTMANNIFFTTELFDSQNIPEIEDWWYYGTEHGQHISFYSLKTLEKIADKYQLNLFSNGRDIHLLTSHPKNSLNIKTIFGLFSNSFISRILVEIIFLFVKFKKTGKTHSDAMLVQNRLKP